MATTSTFAQYGVASTETDASSGTPLTATVGTASTRKSIPLADIAYEIDIEFDGSGDVATIDLDTGIATGGVTGVVASGTVVFTGLPTANDTITVNAVVYTFKASAATATEITIGADATGTASNAASKITLNDTAVSAVPVAGTLTISAANTGEYGNAITLAESADNTTVSGATLTGGIDKVVITGSGVDALGAALPAAALIHAILVTATSGNVTAAVTTLLKGKATSTGGCQFWDSAGRSDLLENLTITSGAVNTVAKVIVRAS